MDAGPAGSPAPPAGDGPTLLPVHVGVLLLAALVSAWVTRRAGPAWDAAREVGAPAGEGTEAIVFALALAAATGLGLALAWLLEAAAAAARLARGRRPGRVLARLGVAATPLLGFGLAHRLASPWLFELVGPARDLLRGWAG